MDKKYTDEFDKILLRKKKKGLSAANVLVQNTCVVMAQFLESEGHSEAAKCLLKAPELMGEN